MPNIDDIKKWHAVKREEYDWAIRNNKKVLAEIIRKSVIASAKKHNLKLQPGIQQTLFD